MEETVKGYTREAVKKDNRLDMADGPEKKKILIVSHFMHIGGVERALLGLLCGIDYSRYEVTLFLFRQEGELLKYIPKQVTLLPQQEAYMQLACPLVDVVRHGHFCIAFARICGKLAAARYRHRHLGNCSQVEIDYSHRYTKRWMPQITWDTVYDLAISFLTPHYFVAEKVRAKRKAAWVHTDYSAIQVDDAQWQMWSAYDRIAAVSASCEQAFQQCFPELRHKTECVENMLPATLICQQAIEERPDWKMQRPDTLKLLSVGRFCEAKNFASVPKLCRRLRENGIRVMWYLIGSGSEEQMIREKIKENHVEEDVIILGKKENPYPYMAACDWYVQPSCYEGKSVAVREAQLLHRPVIITAYHTAKSQLVDGYDGVIVPMETEACAKAMTVILKDPSLRERLIENTWKQPYSDPGELQKIYNWMET